jgi:hypothetical protein
MENLVEYDSNYVGKAEAREPTLTESLSRQLADLNGLLDDCFDRLQTTRDRLWGPQPQQANAAGKLHAVVASVADDLQSAVGTAISRAQTLTSLSGELQRRL